MGQIAVHIRRVKGINDQDKELYQCYVGRETEMHFRLNESNESIGRTIRHCVSIAATQQPQPESEEETGV